MSDRIEIGDLRPFRQMADEMAEWARVDRARGTGDSLCRVSIMREMLSSALAAAQGFHLEMGLDRASVEYLRGVIVSRGIPRRPRADPKDLPREGGVYIVKTEGGPYKIGYSEGDLRNRLACLRNMCPVPLEVAAAWIGATRADEQALHIRFATTRLHGEWFTESPELLAFIKQHAAISEEAQSNG